VVVAGQQLTRPHSQDIHDEVGVAGADPADPAVVVIRLDGTVIPAASAKERAEPNYKGFEFHPLTAWRANTGRTWR